MTEEQQHPREAPIDLQLEFADGRMRRLQQKFERAKFIGDSIGAASALSEIMEVLELIEELES